MKIQILFDSELSAAPQPLCDLCGEVMKKGQLCEYLFPHGSPGNYPIEGDIVEAIVGHTACTKAYEDRAWKKSEEQHGHMSLGFLLYCLVLNTGTNMAEQADFEQWMSRIA